MQIHAELKGFGWRHTTSQACIIIKALHHRFGDYRNKQASDPMPLTRELLNSKSIGFDRQSRTTTVPSFKLLWSGVFVLLSKIHTTHPHTYTHTHCDKVIAISAPPYTISTDNVISLIQKYIFTRNTIQRTLQFSWCDMDVIWYTGATLARCLTDPT